MRRTLLLTAVVLPLGLPAAAPASEYDFGLSTPDPGVSSGMSIRALYRDPSGASKPPPLEQVTVALPAGLRLATSVVPQCTATDFELRLLGRSACPAASRVGSGGLTAVTGFPAVEPVQTDLTVFNGSGELIELVSFKGTDTTAGIDRLKLVGDSLVAHPPSVPGGPPDGRTTVSEIRFSIPARQGVGGRPYITTPPTCPSTGTWTSRLVFKFETYPSPIELTDGSACVHQASKPRIKVSVRPRRAQADTRTRFRFRVASKSASCRHRVRIRVAGRRVRTTRRGRARMSLTLAEPGRRIVRAAKRGCRGDRATIRVR